MTTREVQQSDSAVQSQYIPDPIFLPYRHFTERSRRIEMHEVDDGWIGVLASAR